MCNWVYFSSLLQHNNKLIFGTWKLKSVIYNGRSSYCWFKATHPIALKNQQVSVKHDIKYLSNMTFVVFNRCFMLCSTDTCWFLVTASGNLTAVATKVPHPTSCQTPLVDTGCHGQKIYTFVHRQFCITQSLYSWWWMFIKSLYY